MKRLIIGLGGLVLVIPAALLAIPAFVDLDDYKALIAAEVEKASGRTLAIDGSIDLSLLPSPRVTVTGVRLGNLPGGMAPDMVRVDKVDALVALRPLLSGRLQVVSVTLDQPVITLERLADGRANWELGGTGDGAAPPIALDRVGIGNGTLIVHDATSGTTLQADRIEAEASLGTLAGPYAFDGRFVVAGREIALAVRLGEPSAAGATLGIDLGHGGASLAFAGVARGEGTEREIEGRFEAKGPSADPLLALIAPATPSPFPGALAAAGAVRTKGATIVLSDVEAGIGALRLRGAATVDLGEPVLIEGALAVNSLDLDALLAAGAGGGDGDGMALPRRIEGTLDLSVDAATLAGGVIQQLHAVLTLDGGALAIRNASALLPGGSDVAIAGRLGDGPRFVGTVEGASDDLRALLAWAGIEPGGVPADRLRKGSLSADVRIGPEGIDARDLDLRMDSTRVTGRVGVMPGGRPLARAVLAVDRVNLDAYLPSGEGGGGANLPFDADVALTVGQLMVRGATLSGVGASLALRGDRLRLAALTAMDSKGTTVALDGEAGLGLDTMDLAVAVAGPDLGEIVRLAGAVPPAHLAALGTVALGGTIRREAGTTTVALDAAGDSVEARLRASLSGDTAEGTIEGIVRDASRVLAAAGEAAPRAIARLGSVTVAAAFTRTGTRWTFDGTASADGAEARADGTLDLAGDAVAYDANVSLRHPEASRLAGATGRSFGALDVSGHVKGDAAAVTVSDLAIGVGSQRLDGEATARLDGRRPAVTASLGTNALDLSPFLGEGTGEDGPGDWSDETIDLSPLRALDGALTARAGLLVAGAARLEDAVLEARLADGVLDVTRLEGRLEGGTLLAHGRVAAGPPAVAVVLDLSGADAAATLGAGDALAGTFALRADLVGEGASERAIVESLDGTVAASLREGSVAGFDLGAVVDHLGAAAEPEHFVALLADALRRGSTRIAVADVSFRVADGIATTDDLRADMNGATARGRGLVNLPRRALDLAGEVAFPDAPQVPPIGFAIGGTLDAPAPSWEAAAFGAYLLGSGAAALGLFEGLLSRGGGGEVPALEPLLPEAPEPLAVEPIPEPAVETTASPGAAEEAVTDESAEGVPEESAPPAEEAEVPAAAPEPEAAVPAEIVPEPEPSEEALPAAGTVPAADEGLPIEPAAQEVLPEPEAPAEAALPEPELEAPAEEVLTPPEELPPVESVPEADEALPEEPGTEDVPPEPASEAHAEELLPTAGEEPPPAETSPELPVDEPPAEVEVE